jgi:hypothetical protein
MVSCRIASHRKLYCTWSKTFLRKNQTSKPQRICKVGAAKPNNAFGTWAHKSPLFFKFKNNILKFQKSLKKCIPRGNDVYYKYTRIEFEIHYIISYTKMIKSDKIWRVLFTHLDL